ncbi:hypothetical protein RB594_008996 [Gaeumannomyces avenae]
MSPALFSPAVMMQDVHKTVCDLVIDALGLAGKAAIKMKSFLATVVAFLPLVAAAPTADAGLEKRTPGNVFLCTGSGWGNTCGNFFVGTGGCKPIPEPWRGSVGSAGPDRGALCRLFDASHGDCTGSGLAILESPGNSNLYAGNDAGHKAQFIGCVTCTACQG